jgi:flagellar hook-associated protein 1 FlgK
VSSIGGILSIARSAIQAHQIALQTASQNIANAEVEGYSAQRVNVAANTAQMFTYGALGTGVVVQGVTRSRDVLLDDQYRRASTSSSSYSTARDILGRVEAVLGEPSKTGLSNAMDLFWNSWSDLSSDPSSVSARGVVRQRGTELAGMFNTFANRVDDVGMDARARLTADVGKVNELMKQIAAINPAIVAAESGGQSANDLRDSRDRLLDQVAKLGDLQSIERTDGSVGVYFAGRLFVDGADAHQLAIQGTTTLSVVVKGESSGIPLVGGSVGSTLDMINTEIPRAMANLDALAGAIVREVNAIHSTGKVYSGNPPVAASAGKFFTQSGNQSSNDVAQTARGMRLDSALSDITKIAASAGSSTGPGNNGAALSIAGLRDTTLNFYDAGGTQIANTTLGTFYRDTVASVGLASGQAANAATVHETLANQADTRRQSVSGVATDEELVGLIKHQQAYAAAARLVKVVDEMAQTLIDLGR